MESVFKKADNEEVIFLIPVIHLKVNQKENLLDIIETL